MYPEFKINWKSSLLGLCLVGCQVLPGALPQQPKPSEHTLQGQVQLPAVTPHQFHIQATLTDLLNNSTISLIDVTNNVTVASGLTDTQGNFLLTPAQSVLDNENGAYLLESNKRLDLIGAQALFLRTLVIRQNGNFISLTRAANQPYNKILINTMTTAVSIAEHLDATITPTDVIGTVSGANLLRDLSPAATATVVTNIRTQVETNLTNGIDPLQATYTL